MLSVASRYNKPKTSSLVDCEFFITDPYSNTDYKLVVLDDFTIHSLGIIRHLKINIIESMSIPNLLEYLRAESIRCRIIIRMKHHTKLYSYGEIYETRITRDYLINPNFSLFEWRNDLSNKYSSLIVFCHRYYS